MSDSLASKQYWDSLWESRNAPRAVNPHSNLVKDHINVAFDSLFKQIFKRSVVEFIEFGCANSVWLPYFAKEFGFRVTGIDYSALGCEQAKTILAESGVSGDIVLADIFCPPPSLLNRFAYAVSFGLVEHFKETEECIKACAAFLKPSGILVTVIPNMNGLVGWLQKALGREVYDIHIPLDAETLRLAHENAGLSVLDCEYFCFSNFGVLNIERLRRSFFGLLLSRALNAISAISWQLERFGLKFPANRFTSPYIVGVSVKASM